MTIEIVEHPDDTPSGHKTQPMLYPFPVEIDEGIAPIIGELWQQGVVTLHSCQGSDDRVEMASAGYISFREQTYPNRYLRAGRIVCEVLRKHGREIVSVETAGAGGLTVRFIGRGEPAGCEDAAR